MTPEERLNQLEPLLSETTAILDRHTAQLRQHAGLLKQLVQTTESNSQTLGQVLTAQSDLRGELTQLNSHLSRLATGTGAGELIQEQVGGVESRLEVLENRLETLGGKMDLILTKLIRVYINN